MEKIDAEQQRLDEDRDRKKNWKRWGPYLSEREWGTVREDYSANGDAWNYLPHENSRSQAYRWGEDGIMGITDRECRLCFSVALWNEKDPILKERLFGLTGPESNHGEDVKEEYFYLESTPTHSYLKGLYKYPQNRYPYEKLAEECKKKNKKENEYELLDTGIFDNNEYWDVHVEYAKNSPDDVLIRITISNRGPKESTVHVLPTLWYRNTWSWGCEYEGCWIKPMIRIDPEKKNGRLEADHVTLSRFYFELETMSTGNSSEAKKFLRNNPDWIFTDNESNYQKLYNSTNPNPYVKDAFHRYIINKETSAVNPKQKGTKVTADHVFTIPANSSVVLNGRLYLATDTPEQTFGESFEKIFENRKQESFSFFNSKIPNTLTNEEKAVCVQALSGLLWSKQFYHLVTKDWVEGDPEMPPPPKERHSGRNTDWRHLFSKDVILMPDKWEYPWFAVWDLAFHCAAIAPIDVELAKSQLLLFLREWYMHPNGALPAYEWNFNDVNPPVHAWACWRVYKESGPEGKRDVSFLSRVFQKLLMNFTWWVNRKDINGKHIFSGGFLGLDNIGVFDRSQPLPEGGALEQADGTAWMGFYCCYMLKIALELADHDSTYEDIASKFFEHFVSIADAMNSIGGSGLWEEESGFYYDILKHEGKSTPLKVFFKFNIYYKIKSLVGIVPFFAVANLPSYVTKKFPGFEKRTNWFLKNRKDLAEHISFLQKSDQTHLFLLAIPNKEKLERVAKIIFDENEFLSPFGIRSLSKYHKEHPYSIKVGNDDFHIEYVPGESDSWLFGGNSNWRGPIWMPMNFLLIEALKRFNNFFGESVSVEFPTGSGVWMSLSDAAYELQSRIVSLFLPDPKTGKRPFSGNRKKDTEEHWKENILFHEYFHGDNGTGLGASHQTGWTALVANVLFDLGQMRSDNQIPKCRKEQKTTSETSSK